MVLGGAAGYKALVVVPGSAPLAAAVVDLAAALARSRGPDSSVKSSKPSSSGAAALRIAAS